MGDFVWVVGGIVVFSVLLYLLASAVFGPGEPAEATGEPVADQLPLDRALSAEDVGAVRLRVTFRGYRMSDVDHVLARVAQELPTRAQQSEEQAIPGHDPAEAPEVSDAPAAEVPAAETPAAGNSMAEDTMADAPAVEVPVDEHPAESDRSRE